MYNLQRSSLLHPVDLDPAVRGPEIRQTQLCTEDSVHVQKILLNNILFLSDQLSRAQYCTEQLSVQICIFLYGTGNILYTEHIIVCRLSFVPSQG